MPITQVRTLAVEFQDFMVSDEDEGFGKPKTGRLRRGTPGKIYHYLYRGAKDVQPDDWAIVHNGQDFGLVKIDRVIPGLDDKVTKNVVEVITKGEWEEYLAGNQQIREHRRVFDQLDHMLQQQSKLDQYARLAEANPAAKALLDQIAQFQGSMIAHEPREPYQDTAETETETESK